MKLFHEILYYITLVGFISSCSMGIYNNEDNLSNVGVFLFFTMILISTALKSEKD